MAEKLNVGKPGQVKPNLSDNPFSLCEHINTVPELIDLINSAADDFGYDLDQKPSRMDDEAFWDAREESLPLSPSPSASSSALPSSVYGMKGNSIQDNHNHSQKKEVVELSQV